MDSINAEEDILIINLNNGIKKVIFNRPKKKNAISIKMYKEITNILNNSSKDDSINMVVLTGTGHFFTSGNDLNILNPSISNENFITIFKNFIDALITFPKLLIAVVNGPAIGVGTTLLGLCDIVYASEKAYFYTPFTKLGFTSEGCSSYIFPKIMGPSKASEMLYFGYKMDAKEAKEYRLVGNIYQNEEEVWKYLNKLSQLSTKSIVAIKRLVQKCTKQTLLEINKAETEELKQIIESGETVNRILNFMSNKNKL
ncbi:PREDICTED: enoyl-CoA delta isomerase 2, mitochondrial [Polistes dominula]|uniref:Enoyl-CoA delta isomerase 2, mitochondrial n=1 Tax=Polistes dominula TaxID=743375 RepID=A0ABM1JFF6_POLDO|nr:PREDICTED: enoyl-CoA delta isomerase 2, mitochondrial [Polistes dominula]